MDTTTSFIYNKQTKRSSEKKASRREEEMKKEGEGLIEGVWNDPNEFVHSNRLFIIAATRREHPQRAASTRYRSTLTATVDNFLCLYPCWRLSSR